MPRYIPSDTPRRAVVAAMVERKRRRYPELLTGDVRLSDLVLAMQRDGIHIVYEHDVELGSCMALEGHAFVGLNPTLDTRSMLLTAAHEYGHALLHFGDPAIMRARRAEMIRQRLRYGATAWGQRAPYGPIACAIEAEADLFGAQLLRMPVSAYDRELREAGAALASPTWAAKHQPRSRTRAAA
jgi:hypothetical protein